VAVRGTYLRYLLSDHPSLTLGTGLIEPRYLASQHRRYPPLNLNSGIYRVPTTG
jgi:hypothetical protein